MKISAMQIQALSDAATADFENRMAVHLRRFFPQACQDLGEDGVRDRIRFGISVAETYGAVTERDVCKFIDVMFALGWNFDCDSRFLWAREILTDPSVEDVAVRIEALCDAVERQAASQSAGED